MSYLHELYIHCCLSSLNDFNLQIILAGQWDLLTPQTFSFSSVLSKGRLLSILVYHAHPEAEGHLYKWTKLNSLSCSFFLNKEVNMIMYFGSSLWAVDYDPVIQKHDFEGRYTCQLNFRYKYAGFHRIPFTIIQKITQIKSVSRPLGSTRVCIESSHITVGIFQLLSTFMATGCPHSSSNAAEAAPNWQL